MSELKPGVVGGFFWRETPEGIEAEIVDNITGVTSGSTSDCNAYSDVNKRFDINDPHPCFTDLVCKEIGARQRRESNDFWELVYRFRPPDAEDTTAGQFSSSASLAASRSTRDRDNALVQVTYTYPGNYKDPALAATTSTQTVGVDFSIPTEIMRWTRLNPSFSQANANKELAIWHVNNAVWNGKAIETLLCTRYQIEQAGRFWREIAEFQWQPTGWGVPVTFLQEDDNRPPPDPDTGSEKLADMYPLANFSLLGFALPS